MTSKDKLIEFLKSAKIEYKILNSITKSLNCVQFKGQYYYFNFEGQFVN